jgi:hypothetical protein
MTNDLTITFTTCAGADAVFAAVNDVSGWWTGEIDGSTDELGAEFTYRYQDVHRSTHRIMQLDPGRRITWHTVDSHLSFVDDPAEWTGTDIVFDISPVDGGTQLRFTHVGLSADNECFDSCSPAWNWYIASSLRGLIDARATQQAVTEV